MHTNTCIYECSLFHSRRKPVANKFRYAVYMLYIDLDELQELPKQIRLFGVNYWRPLAFYDRDHFKFANGKKTTREHINEFFQQTGANWQPTRVMLLTNVRVWGYVFNPVSFYFCYDASNQLRYLLAEVNNTFGEQKPYLIELKPTEGNYQHQTQKDFYVSPFITHDIDFTFDFHEPNEQLSIIINSVNGNEIVLSASLTGQKRTLTTSELKKMLWKYPFVTLKVIFMIHYQAFKLFFKKVPYFKKLETDRKIQEAARLQLGEQGYGKK